MTIVGAATKSLFWYSVGAANRNPGIALGSMLFLSGFALIAGNALTAQPGSHPEPFWMTRDSVVTQSVSPKSEIRLAKKPMLVKPVSLKDVPVPTFKSSSTKPIDAGGLVYKIQAELKLLNLYHGEVDGIYGSGTRDSIVQLQNILGLKVTGQATDDLLAILESRTKPRDAKRVNDSRDKAGSVVKVSTDPVVKNIQLGLKEAGLGDIDVDGIYGDQTAAAIRQFQQLHKLTVDGKPSEVVLEKLRTIGALKGI